jgi:hypothetical protein
MDFFFSNNVIQKREMRREEQKRVKHEESFAWFCSHHKMSARRLTHQTKVSESPLQPDRIRNYAYAYGKIENNLINILFPLFVLTSSKGLLSCIN